MPSWHNPITSDTLRAIAREATSEFVSEGTRLTDAVVKAASLSALPLTAEHVRRVCEMTYHDAYERLYKEAGAKDRYVSFDPPDAGEAASRLRSKKVASALTRRTAVTHGHAVEKTASASRRKFQPMNAFDALVGSSMFPSSTEKTAWYNPTSEAFRLRDNLRASVKTIEARIEGARSSEKLGMTTLTKHAMAAHSSGRSVAEILHACVCGDHSKEAAALLSDLARILAYEGCSLLSKEASFSRKLVNNEHPLPQSFAKMADLRRQRVHLEFTLSELQGDLMRINEELHAISN